MIKRQNILELIGKNRAKYHSCILTCYSLDFSFFEERVLPVLRTANIKNVNVFADGKFLETAQENTTGREFKHNKTYSFQPIYATGVFHPKIMLLVGKSHGLLIIGSGNITSSGISTNDEIWGAFHLNTIENENAPLFADVWLYLQQFINQVNGFIPQKMEWIKKYSPWLEQLPVNNKPIKLESLKQTISFVSNSKDESILTQVINTIPKQKLETLTIVSPYYDSDGELLSELYEAYKPKNFNCIVDAEYGLLPTGISNKLKKIIVFYNWKDCKNDYNDIYNRLHAKIFHFQYSDGSEYLMLGSANATIAAMGSSGKKAVNSEAGIIIQRLSKTNYLKELDIKFPKKGITLCSLPENRNHLLPKEVKRKFTARITYSELKGDELTLYLKDKSAIEGQISIQSNNLVETEVVSFPLSSEKINIKCKYPDSVFKICIIDDEGNPVSNYSIVHRIDYLLKCNPDTQQEKLDNLLDGDFPDGEGLTELLQYVDSNWADEDQPNNPVKTGASVRGDGKKEKDSNIKYEKLSPEEFNKVTKEMLLKQAGELTSATVKIADFLQVVSSGMLTKPDDNFGESEEQKLLDDKDQKGEGAEVPNAVRVKPSGEKEKRAISAFFNKLNELYGKSLKKFYDSPVLTLTPNEEINIKFLSNVLIALQLIQIYYNKKFTVEVKSDKEETILKEEVFLYEGNLYSGCDTVKGFMYKIFGKFILLATAKFKEYEYDILNQKLIYNKKQVFLKSIFILLNISCNEEEEDYRNTLFLNIIHYLKTEDVSEVEFISELKMQLDKLRSNAKFIHPSFQDNFESFFNNTIPAYQKWATIFTNPELKEKVIVKTEDIMIEDCIFNSKIGFNVVLNNIQQNDKRLLTLKRAGYEWIEYVYDEEYGYILKDIEYPSKRIVLYK